MCLFERLPFEQESAKCFYLAARPAHEPFDVMDELVELDEEVERFFASTSKLEEGLW